MIIIFVTSGPSLDIIFFFRGGCGGDATLTKKIHSKSDTESSELYAGNYIESPDCIFIYKQKLGSQA